LILIGHFVIQFGINWKYKLNESDISVLTIKRYKVCKYKGRSQKLIAIPKELIFLHKQIRMTIFKQIENYNTHSEKGINSKISRDYKDFNFLFSNTDLEILLEQNKDHYEAFPFDGEVLRSYNAVYFDTPKNQLFIEDHNKKRNRNIVRYVKCIETNKTILEARYLNKKGVKKKKKMQVDSIKKELSENEIEFLSKVLPKKIANNLEARLSLNYKRIVIVGKNNSDRVTIDSDFEVSKNEEPFVKIDLANCKINQERGLEASVFHNSLRNNNIRESKISNYVLGMSIFGKRKSNFYSNKINKITREL